MQLTIVMYHYVRDTARTRFPGVKGLGIEAFRGQLDYLQAHYTIVATEQVLAAIDGDTAALPSNPAWLTFDDGYRDHLDNVFPILAERNLSAAFFPAARPVVEGCVLDVNKIHFILAANPDKVGLARTLLSHISDARATHGLEEAQAYYDRWAKPGRWDPPEVMFVKRVLQRGLPKAARAEIAAEMFRTIVSEDESAFAAELYMSRADLGRLLEAGMYVGNHGYGHTWLNEEPPESQEHDIDRALEFLRTIGAPTKRWVMCYPYGAYNENLLGLLRRKGCAAGVAIDTGIASIGAGDPLVLPRLDTNDFPTNGDADSCDWTRRAIALA